jgi:hypothetical protein
MCRKKPAIGLQTRIQKTLRISIGSSKKDRAISGKIYSPLIVFCHKGETKSAGD